MAAAGAAVDGGDTAVPRDLRAVAGWEVPVEALFVCRAHGTYDELVDTYGPGNVEPVTWARVELVPFYCEPGDHELEADQDGSDV